MTESEHKLIIQMLIQQTRMFSTLIAVLESQGVIQKDDLDAYDALLSENDPEQAKEIDQGVELIYRGFAKALGVNVDQAPAN